MDCELGGEIVKLIKELTPQWQPIETAPKDGTEVLLCTQEYDNINGWYCQADGRWVQGNDLDIYDDEVFIAWMPKQNPEPPKEGE